MTSSDTFTFQDRTTLVKGELRNDRHLAFTFLENASIFEVTHRDILINQVPGNPMDGGLGNVYIRRHRGENISSFPILGPASHSRFRVTDRAASWQGDRGGLDYRCSLQLASDQTMWFWTLRLRNTTTEAQVVDVVLTQDLGLGAPAAVRTNELYTSQYIDHSAYDAGDYGYVVCSRQNQQQGHAFPWLLQGCFQGATGYLTDGFQFFGLSYRETNVPAALAAREFPNTIYQYEFALPALKTGRIQMPPGGSADVTFFAVYEADHPRATSEHDLEKIEIAVRAFRQLPGNVGEDPAAAPLPETVSIFNTASLFPIQGLTSEDLDRHFSPERRHVERQDGAILSFFHGAEYHVVTSDKELLSERPHGHIIRSGSALSPDDNTLSVTAWMDGVFTSHLTIGNTNFNKLLTVSRNPLNVLKSSGQRIFVKTAAGYALLGLPSAFEMGLNSARWIYKGTGVTIGVTLWTSMRDPVCFLEIAVDGPDDLEFLISNNVVLGDTEYEAGGLVRIDERSKIVELVPAPRELMAQKYPEARFFIVPSGGNEIECVGRDGLLFSDGLDRNYPFVVLKSKPVKRVRLALMGNVLSAREGAALARTYAEHPDDREEVARESENFWRGVRKNATLHSESNPGDAAKLNDIVRWYAHNAVVHFTTPYGLEQYSGAAWGVRDVCQGPVEFLLATRNFDAIKGVLKTVYSHQLSPSGDWPQWFMFDRYWNIYAPDSHADVVIWPLKAICDYVEATDDLAVLDEELAFTDDETKSLTPSTTSLFAHTMRQIERMEQGCLPGTALAGYGHGDWEDTLQPADPAVRQRWVSPWTVELMYQTLGRYADVCERAGKRETSERLTSFCTRIRADFNHYLVKDGVVAGLVEFGPESIEYMLHPDDGRTGVKYRLLPMTRGMISGMFTSEQMRDHLALIEKHLSFPDGVRLMDRPMAYHGGTERLFKRAETAANFGREVGLQYVHAHIRYVEAMTRIGRPDEAYQGLLKIVPITIQQVVPSALWRQSNAYFSSSDAAFRDRYDALDQFDRIKRSEIGVKGGWRIYSSGPGMVIAQLILNVLGVRERFSDILLDPVLPASLDGFSFDFEYAARPVRYLYHVHGEGFSPRRVVVNGTDMSTARYAENPYRRGGVLIPKDEFVRALDRIENLVEIFI